MSDPLREAWRAESVKNRRSIAQALEQGKPQRTHRGAVLAVWLGTKQMRRGPKIAGASFVILIAVFVALRVFLEDRAVLDAFADPQVYLIAGLAAVVQLFLFNRQVKQRYHAGVAANVAKLEGRSAKQDLDLDANVKQARDREWLMSHWDRLSH